MAVLVLLDYLKAFDSVDHVALVQKFKDKFRFGDTASGFVVSYLTGRTRSVFIKYFYQT